LIALVWSLYQKQTENPGPATEESPIMARRSKPLPAWILNVLAVPDVAATLLLFMYTTPAPGNGFVVLSYVGDWPALVFASVYPLPLASA
jgi:hypothetical protein